MKKKNAFRIIKFLRNFNFFLKNYENFFSCTKKSTLEHHCKIKKRNQHFYSQKCDDSELFFRENVPFNLTFLIFFLVKNIQMTNMRNEIENCVFKSIHLILT